MPRSKFVGGQNFEGFARGRALVFKTNAEFKLSGGSPQRGLIGPMNTQRTHVEAFGAAARLIY